MIEFLTSLREWPQVFQVFLYLVTGCLTTGVDFAFYNLLSGSNFRWNRVSAHLASTVCAITIGFTLHLLWVFRPAEFLVFERLFKYVATVCVSAYALQTSIIFLLTNLWPAPARVASALGRSMGLEVMRADFVERNFVKLCAVATGLVFNFLSFKWFVYSN